MSDIKMNSEKRKCFIVTPIGNQEDSIRRHIDGIINAAIKPAIGLDYHIKVSHEMVKTGSITKQVIKEIYFSDLIIANLTNTNPNVMYELAFRHCTGKPTIQIAEKGTNIPFDIGPERTIFYQNDSQGVIELQAAIRKYVSEINYNEINQGPIYDVLNSLTYEAALLNVGDADINGGGTKELFSYIIDKLNALEQTVLLNKNLLERTSYETNIIETIKTLYNDIINSITLSDKEGDYYTSLINMLRENLRDDKLMGEYERRLCNDILLECTNKIKLQNNEV